jgi:hypothetical protein
MRKSNKRIRFDFLIFYAMIYAEEHATMSNLPYAVKQYVELRQEASRHFDSREYQECQTALNVAAQY